MKRSRCSKILVFTMVISIFVLAVSQAVADPKEYKNYARIGVGANQPTDDLDDADYDAGVHTSFSYGRYLGKNLIIEGAANWFAADEEFSGSTVTAGTYDREDLLGVSVLSITLKGEFPVGPVRLFAGAGAGAYFANLDSEIDTQNLGSFDVDDQDEVFGAHVVAGGSYDITSRVFIGIEGLYRWTDDIDIRKTVGTVPVQYKGNLDGFAITFSGGFRF